MLEKARAISGRVDELRRSFAGAHRLAHLAQTQEALTRAELSLALAPPTAVPIPTGSAVALKVLPAPSFSSR